MAVSDAEQVVLVEIETANARLTDKDRRIATRPGCKVIEVSKAPHASEMGPGANVSFHVAHQLLLRLRGLLQAGPERHRKGC